MTLAAAPTASLWVADSASRTGVLGRAVVAATEVWAPRRTEIAVADRQGDQTRQWWDILVHDKVLAALLMGSRAATPGTLAAAGRLAQDALDALADHDTVGDEPRPETFAEVIERYGACLGLSVRTSVDASSCPRPVLRAAWSATQEALLNVAKHAGTTQAEVTVRGGPAELSVVVRDNGRGFDPVTVPPERFGLRRSIPGSLATVGGTVIVRSAPGGGTAVRLEWHRATAAAGAVTHTPQIGRPSRWASCGRIALHLPRAILWPGPSLTAATWLAVTLSVGGFSGLRTRRADVGPEPALTAEHSRRMELLTRDAVPLLRRLVDTAEVTEVDRTRFRLVEAALRDHLLAEPLLTPQVEQAVAQARARGARVVLYSSIDTRTSIQDPGTSRRAGVARRGHATDPQAAPYPPELTILRSALVEVLAVAGTGSTVHARWSAGSTGCAATIAAQALTGTPTNLPAPSRSTPCTVELDGQTLWFETTSPAGSGPGATW